MSDSRYNEFPDVSGYPVGQQTDQASKPKASKQNSMLDADREESQVADSDYAPGYQETGQDFLEENDQIQDLEEVFHDEFSTLRLK